MGTVSKKGKTSVSNQPSAGHKEYATKQKVYEEPKKGKGKAFLFLLIAACLAVGAYFVIKLDVLVVSNIWNIKNSVILRRLYVNEKKEHNWIVY